MQKDLIVETGYRLRMWWLTWMRGYTITNRKRIPKSNVFGEIYYKNVWVLSKHVEEEDFSG